MADDMVLEGELVRNASDESGGVTAPIADETLWLAAGAPGRQPCGYPGCTRSRFFIVPCEGYFCEQHSGPSTEYWHADSLAYFQDVWRLYAQVYALRVREGRGEDGPQPGNAILIAWYPDGADWHAVYQMGTIGLGDVPLTVLPSRLARAELVSWEAWGAEHLGAWLDGPGGSPDHYFAAYAKEGVLHSYASPHFPRAGAPNAPALPWDPAVWHPASARAQASSYGTPPVQLPLELGMATPQTSKQPLTREETFGLHVYACPDGKPTAVRTARAPANITFHHILRSVSSAEGYTRDENDTPVDSRTFPSGSTALSVRVPKALQAELPGAKLVSWQWDQVRRLDRRHKWTLLVIAIHSLAAATETGDPIVVIDAPTILDARGKAKIRKLDEARSGAYRTAGHRTEDMAPYDDVIERLSYLYVQITLQLKGRKRPVDWESRLIVVEDRFDEPGHPLRWRLKVGNWIWAALGIEQADDLAKAPHVAHVLETVLGYHDKDELWEGEIGLYLQFFTRINEGKPYFIAPGTLIRENGLPINARYPAKTYDRLELALNNLQRDGVIGAWRYKDGVEPLRGHGWLERYLDTWTIQITPPVWQQQQYAMLNERSASHRTRRKKER